MLDVPWLKVGSLVHAFPESSDQFLLKIDWTVVRIHATVHNANQFWRSWNYLFIVPLKFSLLNFPSSISLFLRLLPGPQASTVYVNQAP